jgi:Alw26I/Eco31I/Esp3I family type II restriction m6 adenine DNA methyltransferase
MKHVELAQSDLARGPIGETWLQNLTGRYYTHQAVGRHLSRAVWEAFAARGNLIPNEIAICDPFAGDGRLVAWLIEQACGAGARASWRVELWDLHEDGLREAERALDGLAHRLGIRIECKSRVIDTFAHAADLAPEFDIVVTNPPWENLKPDRRELSVLSEDSRASYLAALRETDIFLSRAYSLSQPRRKFAGWGTNLARVGIEVSVRIAKMSGVVGVVSPASFLADDASSSLRRWLLLENELLDLAYFPAEARLFGRADVPTATFVARRARTMRAEPVLTMFHPDLTIRSQGRMALSRQFLESFQYLVPISPGHQAVGVLQRFSEFPSFGSLEDGTTDALWAGRELDETAVERFLIPAREGEFIKGRMIGRFEVRERPKFRVNKPGWRTPKSSRFERVAWRDVSRPTQKRRVQATLIPPGWIAGNSIGVAHFRNGDPIRLRVLLGLMNSFPFEFQLRNILATGHVTLSALRRVRLPAPRSTSDALSLVDAVERRLQMQTEDHVVEAAAARLFGLTSEDLDVILECFPKVRDRERYDLLSALSTRGLK